MLRFQPARRHAHVLRYGQDQELLVRLRLPTLWLLGDPEEADRQRDLALAVAEKFTHPYGRATTRVWAVIVAIHGGGVAEFRRHVQALARDMADDAPAQVRSESIGRRGVTFGPSG